ncbi:hypothetical protein EV356DRAFT_510654 [Viridothelium virens]|uniref:DUF7707 domain-containing protein n=1 Tax=Viridothelium virens TaxID=1048519 RepID=A0A6A6HIM0_VIRVR|nr:hypothetical protein EV356DRAFT_510654 [Viridothelium virens]
MYYSIALVIAATFSSLVAAQNISLTNPVEVNSTERQQWCRAQVSNCPMICGGSASPNTCDPMGLTYQCVCTDGSHPNVSDYASTLPSFICAQNVADCVNSHPNDLQGITNCRNTVCGTKNASAALSTSSSASSTPTATGSGGSSGTSPTSSGSTSAAATSSAAMAALNLGKTYGTGALAAGLFAVFGLAF